VEIYVRLLNEGVDVWRPVEAEPLPDGTFRLASSPPPPDEVWEFPPGATVRCERKSLGGGEARVAIALGATSERVTLLGAD
jgi:hypothetical protein